MVSKILEQVNGALKGNPLLYALILINVIFLGVIWHVQSQIAANAVREDAIIEKCVMDRRQ
jgi:hypothetical protein